MKKIYFAGPLFDEASRDWNVKIVSAIREKYDVEIYLPQENSEINDKSDCNCAVTSIDIFDLDTEKLEESDILIANLDGGLEIDSGVACEIGYFSALCTQDSNKKIVGLISDVRWNACNGAPGEQHGVYKNLYVIGAIKKHGVLIVNDFTDFSTKILTVLDKFLDKK